MKEQLNVLEKAIIDEIVNFNKEEYPSLKSHIHYLRVKSREYTGVGIYVNFNYLENYPLMNNHFKEKNIFLSSSKSLEIDSLKYELNYELNITNGKFDFLELVTNGEDWDGDFSGFKFVDHNGTAPN